MRQLILLLALAAATAASAVAANPKFASASIKPNKSGTDSMAFGCHGTDTAKTGVMIQFGSSTGKQLKVSPAPLGSCSATNISLEMLIAYAYNLAASPTQVDQRVLFGPGWAATARFDIQAKAAKPVPEADLRTMLQALLADQFKLQIRHEIQQDPGYVLVVAPSGAKLMAPRNDIQLTGHPGGTLPPIPDGVMKVTSTSNGQTFRMPWARISNLTDFLSLRLRKTVIDQTHLTGTYDITLVLPPINTGHDGLAPLFTAMQEQLGLRLDAQNIPTETIVIDNAEEPVNTLSAAMPKPPPAASSAPVNAKSLSCKMVLPSQAAVQRSSARRPAMAPATDLQTVLSRARTYVAGYENQLGNLIGEEIYVQSDAVPKNIKSDKNSKQRTESDFALLHVGSDWVGVREVTCVDGITVPRPTEDFHKILDDSPSAVLGKINNALRESERFNIGVIQRNTNLPTFALRILRAGNGKRFEFKKSTEDVLDGVRTWIVSFQETQTPTIIRDDGHDEFANGALWIEPETGRILKTEVNLSVEQGPESFHSQMVVSYKDNATLQMLVPASMEEHYKTGSGRTLDCRADYFNFHRFEVETKFDFGPPVPKPVPN